MEEKAFSLKLPPVPIQRVLRAALRLLAETLDTSPRRSARLSSEIFRGGLEDVLRESAQMLYSCVRAPCARIAFPVRWV